jgi:hypothetical protein
VSSLTDDSKQRRMEDEEEGRGDEGDKGDEGRDGSKPGEQQNPSLAVSKGFMRAEVDVCLRQVCQREGGERKPPKII